MERGGEVTNDEIRLKFGELNAAEMRLARAIVGWHEAEQAKLRVAADWLAEAVKAIVCPLGDETEDSGNPCTSPNPSQGRAIAAALAAYQATKP